MPYELGGNVADGLGGGEGVMMGKSLTAPANVAYSP